MESTTRKVRARWPFTGAVTVHVEKIAENDDESTVLIEVERPDGRYLNVSVPRAEFLAGVRHVAERFFVAMRARVEDVAPLAGRQGYLPPAELARQGAQWQRRVEALLKRAAGESFAPLKWTW